ncbi:MAG: hypothetical protein R3D29_10365 [Nitratireductor sp.]
MAERYPVFLSSLTERRMLFERPITMDSVGSQLSIGQPQILN